MVALIELVFVVVATAADEPDDDDSNDQSTNSSFGGVALITCQADFVHCAAGVAGSWVTLQVGSVTLSDEDCRGVGSLDERGECEDDSSEIVVHF